MGLGSEPVVGWGWRSLTQVQGTAGGRRQEALTLASLRAPSRAENGRAIVWGTQGDVSGCGHKEALLKLLEARLDLLSAR